MEKLKEKLFERVIKSNSKEFGEIDGKDELAH